MWRSSRPDVLCEKGVLRNFAKFTGNSCARVSFLIKLQAACNFIKKDTLAQVFSFEFSKFRGTPFFTEHLWWLLLNVQWILKSLEEIFRAMQKYILILHNFYNYFWNLTAINLPIKLSVKVFWIIFCWAFQR